MNGSNKFAYPLFKPAKGRHTDMFREKYVKHCIKKGLMPEDSISNEKINSLVASNDPEDKIHFWQLYSVLGEDGMKKVITIFYMSVLNDTENAWFSEAFKEKSLKRHVRGQCEFWLDLMGGGVEYKKGLEGLECLHEASSEVMTSKGAKVW
eukprot:CAMPEP_0185253558 /NCGR_PEP_ID=MMETSP1359-20130426/2258_1 /TAXON_ID=552665 /ORGANISM="Bigelowiella longifila, Strain CCMP242" /LENGTH=150 /DNA_ID=CAMNT_0027835955 /DNA_START=74 /DNA_END=523 /DNA_ORIENTATION=-